MVRNCRKLTTQNIFSEKLEKSRFLHFYFERLFIYNSLLWHQEKREGLWIGFIGIDSFVRDREKEVKSRGVFLIVRKESGRREIGLRGMERGQIGMKMGRR